MRIVTWNCSGGGLRNKAENMLPLHPDILVLQEVTRRDEAALLAGEPQPTFHERMAAPGLSGGVCAYSYGDTKLTPIAVDDPIYGFHLYEAQHGDLDFQVVAVWASYTKAKETRYTQVHEGLRRYAEWIGQRPTVILGDFHNNGSFNAGNWSALLDLMQSLGLVSAYHQYFSEPFGEETRQTYFFRGMTEPTFHLDYIFLPEAWAQHITKVEVGSYYDWHKISDHMPLIVDLSL